MFPETFPVTCHTDFVEPGGTYVVIQGQNQDGLMYVEKALAKGAKTIVFECGVVLTTELKKAIKAAGATLKRVANARKALALLSAKAAGYPAHKLKIIAITGTKGKTTTAHVLYHLLVTNKSKVALIGTIENKISTIKQTFKTPWTTPQPDYLHQFFKLCVQEGVEYVVMETAAHAETFHKLDTLMFDGAIFTNLEQEHGELYPTMEDYFQAKAAIMNRTKPDLPQVINGNDEYGIRLCRENPIGYLVSYGDDESNVYDILIPPNALVPIFIFAGQPLEYSGHFPGEYNIYNIAAAVAMCSELEMGVTQIIEGLKTLPSLPGRYEPHELPNGAWGIIDYAHTPASFEGLFKTVKNLKPSGKLIVVFGASGGKDKLKRPMMGAVAAQYADIVILTSDNPGPEDPKKIAKEIEAGIPKDDRYKVYIELDREQAIRNAYAASNDADKILLLGKGPDEYQKLKDEVVPFSEREILQSLG